MESPCRIQRSRTLSISSIQRTKGNGTGRFRFTSIFNFYLLTLCLLSVISPSLSTSTSNPTKSEFHESLLLRSLPDGRLHASFSFQLSSISNSSIDDSHPLTSQHFTLLPRQLIQIARSRNVKDLHLSLNTGKWDYERWGWPTVQVDREGGRRLGRQMGEENVGSGAEMWASLRGSQNEIDSSSTSIPSSLLTRWRSLTSSLAGLFCASLDALDSTATTLPNFPLAFHSSPFSSSSSTSKSNAIPQISSDSTLLHAFLPTETICTENLTPFLKLLPCRNQAGLASLLTPHEVFGAGFHGMGVHLWRIDDEGEDGLIDDEGIDRGWKVELNFQAVFSPALRGEVGRRDWSLSSIFNKKLESSCPLATTSEVRVMRPLALPASVASTSSSKPVIKQLSIKDRYVLDPIPPKSASESLPKSSEQGAERSAGSEDDEAEEEVEEEDLEAIEEEQRLAYEKLTEKLEKSGDVVYDCLDLAKYENSTLDVGMRWPGEQVFEYPDRIVPPTLLASRSFLGYGQERGMIELKIRNNELGRERTVLYVEQLPWFVKPLLHTMTTEVKEDEFDEDSPIVHFKDDLTLPILESISYQPSVPRERPSLIEATLRIPATSSITLKFKYEKAFLRYMEHPPDAHRGFDLPPAIIQVLDEFPISVKGDSSIQVYDFKRRENINRDWDGNREQRRFSQRRIRTPKIFTSPSLVELAVPDFSMPYNVIIMTSTVIALFFGSVFNNLVRTYKDVPVES